MDRRSLVKLTSVSVIASFAGCTSLSNDSDDNGSEDEDNEDPLTEGETSDGNETNETDGETENESDTPDDENQGGSDDDNETDGETPNETETDETPDETDTDEEAESDDETPDETGDGGTSEESDGDDTSEEQTTDEADDEDQNQNESEGSDEPPAPDEMEATVRMGSELDGILDVVDHEFVWESYSGSHLCNVRVELRNASDSEIWFEGIVTTTNDNGNSLGGDIAQFGLDPEETTTYVFSMDGCANVTGYQLGFEAL